MWDETECCSKTSGEVSVAVNGGSCFLVALESMERDVTDGLDLAWVFLGLEDEEAWSIEGSIEGVRYFKTEERKGKKWDKETIFIFR